ncbi:MAG: AI-2E family transporter [Polyangiaceae bacterium]|nr:AI-2E family transporter [Polyangiaceae bacterium]
MSVSAEKRELVFGKSWYWLGALVLVGVVLHALRDVLTPIFLAVTIAYILDPVVDRLERWRIPRGAAIAIVLVGFTGAVTAFLLLVIPEIARDVASVAKELPGHVQRGLARLEPILRDQGIAMPHTTDEWIAQLKSKADSISASQLAPVGNALKAVIGGTVSAIGAVFGALIVPILAVYLLADFDRMVSGVHALVPLRFRDSVAEIASEIDHTLSQFMRGQLTVMLILAVLYGGAYWLLGVRLAIPIGIAAGILNFVPYVGGAFALVAGIIMSLIGGGGMGQIAGVVIAYAVVQTLEGFVITPRIVGESVGLSEIWVLLALFVGGEAFGFLGVLLAVPLAAVLKIFVARALSRYRESELFLTPAAADGVIPPLAVPPEPEVEPPEARAEPPEDIPQEAMPEAPETDAPETDAAEPPAPEQEPAS